MRLVIDIMFGVFILFFVLAISGFVIVTFITAFPDSTAKTLISGISNDVFGFIDLSFIVLIILALFIDVLSSYTDPSIAKAVFNLVLIFVIGYLNLTLIALTTPISTSLNSINLLPQTTSFVLGTSKAFIFLIFLALSVILNVRAFRPADSPDIMRNR